MKGNMVFGMKVQNFANYNQCIDKLPASLTVSIDDPQLLVSCQESLSKARLQIEPMWWKVRERKAGAPEPQEVVRMLKRWVGVLVKGWSACKTAKSEPGRW